MIALGDSLPAERFFDFCLSQVADNKAPAAVLPKLAEVYMGQFKDVKAVAEVSVHCLRVLEKKTLQEYRECDVALVGSTTGALLRLSAVDEAYKFSDSRLGFVPMELIPAYAGSIVSAFAEAAPAHLEKPLQGLIPPCVKNHKNLAAAIIQATVFALVKAGEPAIEKLSNFVATCFEVVAEGAKSDVAGAAVYATACAGNPELAKALALDFVGCSCPQRKPAAAAACTLGLGRAGYQRTARNFAATEFEGISPANAVALATLLGARIAATTDFFKLFSDLAIPAKESYEPNGVAPEVGL